MTDEKIIEILYRDGYHCAAQRLEELLLVEKLFKSFGQTAFQAMMYGTNGEAWASIKAAEKASV
jgi:hypothetical protein